MLFRSRHNIPPPLQSSRSPVHDPEPLAFLGNCPAAFQGIRSIIVSAHREVEHLLQEPFMLFIEFDIVVLYIWLHGLNSHGLITGLRYFFNREVKTGPGGCLGQLLF